ncbi:Glu/Leu/Phe/Val dehydrogenase [Thermodesulfobacteriota bacterium]
MKQNGDAMIEYDEFGPEKIISVYDSKIGMQGIVVVDNTVLGPGKGGIRMTSTVDTEEVAKLARSMTWKCALAELPFGGAKAGLIADSKNIPASKKKDFVIAFSAAIKVFCPQSYIAAPDMYMGEQEMAWFAEANGDKNSCTGKPEAMGGIPHELGGTGFGVFHATRVAAEIIGLDLKKATFAVEGFGNVGKPAAKYLNDAGARFIAVSDSQGSIYEPNGLSYEKVEAIKKKGMSVIHYARDGEGEVCNQRSCDHILDVKADILITAARPNLIRYGDVPRLHFKLIVEGSNIPMAFSVENQCYKKGITIVPDIIANSGGVISSYAEHQGIDEAKMFELIEETVSKNTHLILEEAQKTDRLPRKEALNLAKRRVRENRR